MTYKDAREFVRKFYGEDEFTIKVIKAGNINKKQTSTDKDINEKEQLKLFAAAAKEMGYNIAPEEFKAASEEYFNELSGWQAISKILHIAKLAKRIEKEKQ